MYGNNNQPNYNNNNDLNKITSNVEDENVGKLIKIYSTKFFEVCKVLYSIVLIAVILSFIGLLIQVGDEGEDGAIFAVLIGGAIVGCLMYLIYCAMYFMYLKNLGYGIMVQDINQVKKHLIPEKEIKKEKTKTKEIKKLENEILYCDNCGAETTIKDKKCPGCGISFED